MKKKALILAIMGLAMMSACDKHGQESNIDNESHATQHDSVTAAHDTLLVITAPDNAIWGHLGEGTAMSVIEFITDNGDTLTLTKTDEFTGQEGRIIGSLRNMTDRFCIVANTDSTSLVKAINVTEMQETWADATIEEREQKTER